MLCDACKAQMKAELIANLRTPWVLNAEKTMLYRTAGGMTMTGPAERTAEGNWRFTGPIVYGDATQDA